MAKTKKPTNTYKYKVQLLSPFKVLSLKGGLQGFVWLEETTAKKITHIQRQLHKRNDKNRDYCMKMWESPSSYTYVLWRLYTLHTSIWPYWPLVLHIVPCGNTFVVKLLNRKNLLQILILELDICGKFSFWITFLQFVWMDQYFFLFQIVVAVHFLQFVVRPWVTQVSPN